MLTINAAILSAACAITIQLTEPTLWIEPAADGCDDQGFLCGHPGGNPWDSFDSNPWDFGPSNDFDAYINEPEPEPQECLD